MTIKLDEIRLSDYALSEYKSPSFFVEKQFPSIYLEEGQELVELVKAYYRFLETQANQSVYNNRRMYEYRNIDTTLDRMLVFFKNKFLNGLFFDNDQRFIVKNILDLYRRKGSKEGIELFFKLFFESEVSVYYPSEDIFKPSTSTWKVGSFIQLYGITDTTIFSDIVNRKIYGDKSKAQAFVDNVYFINVRKQTIPILFISDVKGSFVGFDTIYSLDPDKTYGRVYGSLRRVSVDRNVSLSTGENKVGDIVEIRSETGYGAKGRVSKVTQSLTGQIDFKIVDGDYGYTVENTTISVSNQTVFFSDNSFSVNPFIVGERIQQTNSSLIEVIGRVLGKTDNSIGVYLDLTQPESANTDYAFDGSSPIYTIDRETNITVSPAFATSPNFSAYAEIGEIKNTETITIITDVIGDFANVTLDSINYSSIPPASSEMSGTRVNGVTPTANTPLNEAFVPEEFIVGSISTLKNIDPGLDHDTDAFVLAEDSIFSTFNLKDQLLNIVQSAGVVIFTGDIVVQTRQIKNFEGDIENIEVKGRVVDVIGNVLFVKQLSFYSFVTDEPLYKEGNPIPVTILSRSRDVSSIQFGANAKITGSVESITGRILEIEIFDSGFAYEDQQTVEIFNVTRSERLSANNEVDAVGIAFSRDQGITEGRWITFFSNTNQEKVIQDSFYYQDYSYEIASDVQPTTYVGEYREIMHPSGLKLFTRFAKSDVINIGVAVSDVDVSTYPAEDYPEMNE